VCISFDQSCRGSDSVSTMHVSCDHGGRLWIISLASLWKQRSPPQAFGKAKISTQVAVCIEFLGLILTPTLFTQRSAPPRTLTRVYPQTRHPPVHPTCSRPHPPYISRIVRTGIVSTEQFTLASRIAAEMAHEDVFDEISFFTKLAVLSLSLASLHKHRQCCI
jgi:hypothetical protein